MSHTIGIPSKTLSSVKFTSYTGDEIRKLSVKQVTHPHSLDSLLHPIDGGLYDSAYGATTKDELCSTCGQSTGKCPGHMGHIELPLPIYNPVFFKSMFNLLCGSCLQCQKLLVKAKKLQLLVLQLEAISSGLVHTVQALREANNEIKGKIPNDMEEDLELDMIQEHLGSVLSKHRQEYSKSLNCNKDSVEGDSINIRSRNSYQIHLELVAEFVHMILKKQKRCPHCGAPIPVLRAEHSSRIYVMAMTLSGRKADAVTQTYLTPSVVRDHISLLWKNEHFILSRIFVAMNDAAGKKETEMFGNTIFSRDKAKTLTNAVDVLFISVLPVPPSRFRPVGAINDKQFEGSQTTAYSKVMSDSCIIRALIRQMSGHGDDDNELSILGDGVDWMTLVPGKSVQEKLENAWHRLQQRVNALFDSDLDRIGNYGSEKQSGIRQLLERKDGLFRKYMMGKRVNNAARSVISPDPYIATNEIGVPLVFATRLTYPIPVTPWNVQKLRKAVLNGPDVHPGATHIVLMGGVKVAIREDDETQREALAKTLIATSTPGKIVEPNIVLRHIQTGDVMLLNRQPTLHKGSIMAHKVRVLPGEKTLRLHYANCKSYNADFDGDEMNAHFPQTEVCRSEALQLMLTDEQYLSAKDGKPLSCLIQDHMVAGVNISMRGRFFRRDEYYELLYNALVHLPYKVKLLKPAILKPEMLWTGKQVFSTLLINIIPDGLPLINLTGKSKIREKNWQKHPPRVPATANIDPGDMCESQVIVRNAELLCGVLDKAHYGATEFGLVHATYELYGGAISGRLLSCLARLFTAFLQIYKGFTLGVEDILVTASADAGRTDVIDNMKEDGMTTVAKILHVKHKNNPKEVTNALWDAHVATKIPSLRGPDKLAMVDHSMKQVSNSINDDIAKWCTGNGLLKTFPENNLQLMVTAGAKGGPVNCIQISCSLGQIELEGRRPPLMSSGRSIPSFKAYDTTLRAGGFISQRFLTGLRPQEYFIHCMAGREGLIDTAIKTSQSGYLQRCLIKHLEGLLLTYDMTVRDSDGAVMQFLYGEDGIDIIKSAYLQEKQYKFAIDNFEAMMKQLPSMDTVESRFDVTSADRKWKKFQKIRKRHERKLKDYPERNKIRNCGFHEFETTSSRGSSAALTQEWHDLDAEKKNKFCALAKKCDLPDPVISQLRPDLHFGAMSDLYKRDLQRYLRKHNDELSQEDDQCSKTTNGKPSLARFEKLMKLRYQRALGQPGEGVGLLAAQSVGEPSTQMTLNTFHFAGRGEMNVTLGIPRLREILMVASKRIKTPQMTIPVIEGRRKRAKRLCKELTRIVLSQVLHKFNLEETLVVDDSRFRRCVLTMHVLPEQQFGKDMALTRDNVILHIEKRFLRDLVTELSKQLKKRTKEDLVVIQRVTRDFSKKDARGAPGEDTIPEEDMGQEAFKRKHGEGNSDNEYDESADYEKRKKSDEVDYDEEEENEDDEECLNEAGDTTNVDEENKTEEIGVLGEERGLSKTTRRIFSAKSLGNEHVTVEDYEYDTASYGWCRITLLMPLRPVHVDIVSLVRNLAMESAVRQTSGLHRCILVKPQAGADTATTNLVSEGVNFFKMFEQVDCLDVNKIYCNCVHSMVKTYGIEAGRCVIVKEVANVFAVYGIEVDLRHLTLIADYMCYEGWYKPFNRFSITTCVSPFQQMSFESTFNFINKATLLGASDNLMSPSARIVTGQVVNGGTGNFSLIYPVADHA